MKQARQRHRNSRVLVSSSAPTASAKDPLRFHSRIGVVGGSTTRSDFTRSTVAEAIPNRQRDLLPHLGRRRNKKREEMGDDVETEGRMDGPTRGRTDAAERSSDAAFSRQRAASGALPVGSPHSVGGCRSETAGRRTDGRPGLCRRGEGLAVGRCRRARGREGNATGALHFAYVLHPFLSQDGRTEGAALQLKKKRASAAQRARAS